MGDFIDDCFDGLLGDEPLREIETREAYARRTAWEEKAKLQDMERAYFEELADLYGGSIYIARN